MGKSTTNEEKLYYSISEVSRITGLEPYVLRYWEKEFPLLKPKKNPPSLQGEVDYSRRPDPADDEEDRRGQEKPDGLRKGQDPDRAD